MNGYEELIPKCEEKDCEHWVDGHCNDNGEVHCPNKPINIIRAENKWREDVIGTLKLMSNIIAEQTDKISELECRVAKIEENYPCALCECDFDKTALRCSECRENQFKNFIYINW